MNPGRPLLACGRTIKFHFCRANVFELAIKQRFSPPSQRTTRPRRGVGPFSFFVYSPTNWFCGIHRPFFSSSSSPSCTPFSPAVSGKPRAISGYANTPGLCARGANEQPWHRHSTCNIVDKSQRGASAKFRLLIILSRKMYQLCITLRAKNLWMLLKNSRLCYFAYLSDCLSSRVSFSLFFRRRSGFP